MYTCTYVWMYKYMYVCTHMYHTYHIHSCAHNSSHNLHYLLPSDKGASKQLIFPQFLSVLCLANQCCVKFMYKMHLLVFELVLGKPKWNVLVSNNKQSPVFKCGRTKISFNAAPSFCSWMDRILSEASLNLWVRMKKPVCPTFKSVASDTMGKKQLM